MPTPIMLKCATPHVGRGESMGVDWAPLIGTVVLTDNMPPMKKYRFQGDFHFGHPVYQGDGEEKIFWELGKWYCNGGFAGYFKLVTIDHRADGDPNLPPAGTGWVFAKDGTPSGFSFSLHKGFETKVANVERDHLLKGQTDKLSKARIVAAHNARLELAEKERAERLAAEEAVIAAAERRRTELEAEHDAKIAMYKTKAAQAEADLKEFVAKVETEGLVGLDCVEAFEVLQILGVHVDKWTVASRDWNGVALAALTEKDMEEVLNIKALGARRRLSEALKRLSDKKGFKKPPSSQWDVSRVSKWLADEHLSSLCDSFEACSIDGEALLTITENDLGYFGIDTPAGKIKVLEKINSIRDKVSNGA